MARNLAGKKTREKTKSKAVGIPGDTYRTEIKGNLYYVVNSKTRVTVAGPYKTAIWPSGAATNWNGRCAE